MGSVVLAGALHLLADSFEGLGWVHWGLVGGGGVVEWSSEHFALVSGFGGLVDGIGFSGLMNRLKFLCV